MWQRHVVSVAKFIVDCFLFSHAKNQSPGHLISHNWPGNDASASLFCLSAIADQACKLMELMNNRFSDECQTSESWEVVQCSKACWANPRLCCCANTPSLHALNALPHTKWPSRHNSPRALPCHMPSFFSVYFTIDLVRFYRALCC